MITSWYLLVFQTVFIKLKGKSILGALKNNNPVSLNVVLSTVHKHSVHRSSIAFTETVTHLFQ